MKNKEFRREVLFSLLLIAAFLILCALFWRQALVPLLFLSLLLLGLHLLFTERRYADLARLSDRLDQALYAENLPQFADFEEGELSILESQIGKLLGKLREQTNRLKIDKVRLKEAMEDISHQLRTPITVFFIQLELLKDPTISQDRRRILLRKISQQAEQMQWLVEALLKLSRIDTGTLPFEKKTISVKKLLQEALASFEIPLELKGISVDLAAEKASFVGDYRWTLEAIENLIKNSMEHTPEGGTIRIAAQENNLFTEILLHDNGPGFDAEDLAHLFERFYKGKNSSAHSIGIGLSLAQAIIREQNGTIKPENDQGALFRIRFYKTGF